MIEFIERSKLAVERKSEILRNGREWSVQIK